MAVRGVLEAMRSTSDSMRGENLISGALGTRGCGVVLTLEAREEAMRACARAVEVGVGGRSISMNAHEQGVM